MIVKKLYRKLNIWYTKDDDKREYDDITDYIGYYLFGLIPIYLIQIDKYTRSDNGIEFREDVIEKYKNTII